MSNNSTSSNDTNNYHVCRICSDRAIGYNFSVLTCEPCKAFFRRTADKLEELQCPFNNDCDIDRITRKICRRCRLVKCLKVGMRKDWAQSDDEKKSRYDNCTSGARGGGKSHTTISKSPDFSLTGSKGSCKSRCGGNLSGFSSDGGDHLLRELYKCNKFTVNSKSFTRDIDSISPAPNHVANNWSTSSLPTPSSLVSMSPVKMGSLNQLPVKSQSTSLTSSCSSSTSSLPSAISSSSSSLSSTLSSPSPSSQSSYLNHYGQNKHNSGLMSIPCSSSSSSSSSIIPTIDLLNSLQRNCCSQSNCKRQSREDIQSILKSDINSDWLIRFLVESHALNLPTSRPMINPEISELNSTQKTNQHQPPTSRPMVTFNCSQHLQSSLQSNLNPCTRVGVIVDGRKLGSSNSPSPPSTISANKSCVYPLITCSERKQQPPPPLTSINNQIDYNLKARVIRKILDANFAPSHLKQGCRKGVALDDMESETIDNLVNAFDFFNQPLTVNNCELTSIEGVTQFTDLYLEKLISGCRCLSSYAKLCLEDQINLVKGGFPDILTVRGHLCTSNSTTSSSSSPKASDNCWQATNQHHNQQTDHPTRLVQDSFSNESDHGNALNLHWISDPKVVCILIAIVLFNPELPNLLAIDTIKLEQYTYIYLLKRYLEAQCGSSCRARTEHFNLIHSIVKIMITRMERASYPPRMTADHLPSTS